MNHMDILTVHVSKPGTLENAWCVCTIDNVGRVGTYCINIGGGTCLTMHVVYLWTGSAINPQAATRSDEVIDAIINEDSFQAKITICLK